jgi:hypothetical protein
LPFPGFLHKFTYINEKDNTMKLKFTAVFQEVAQGYIGFVEELPGAKYPRQDTGRSKKEP